MPTLEVFIRDRWLCKPEMLTLVPTEAAVALRAELDQLSEDAVRRRARARGISDDRLQRMHTLTPTVDTCGQVCCMERWATASLVELLRVDGPRLHCIECACVYCVLFLNKHWCYH